MRPHPRTLQSAVKHLAAADPKLGAAIARVGPCRFRVREGGSQFEYLARIIIFQQLSTGAASTIHGRFCALFPGGQVEARALLALPEAAVRGAGVSGQKLRYLRDLAAHVRDDALPLDTIHELTDDEVITALTTVKGIGRWTAQMFLMFRLGRLDVLPELDLGVQKGLKLVHGLRTHPDPKRLTKLGAKWAPFRSVAAWYMWQVLDSGEWT
jgi:DNA-3-methyladenine glycosylase II